MRPTLYLFAKQPVPGRVKTRLQTHCSPEQAAAVAATMITATARRAAAAWPGQVTLCGWPDTEHALFVTLACRFGLGLLGQPAGSLGEKMLAVLEVGINRGGGAAVMGCDVPHVPPDDLRLAYAALAGGRNVLGPAADGGFYFIGLCRTASGLFDGVEWGTREVAAQTVKAARTAGIEFHAMLTELRDVDSWEDLQVVAESCPELKAHTGCP